MFMFKAGVYLEELKKLAPDIYESSLEAYKKSKRGGNVIRIREEEMDKIREESIDYTVMEKSKK